MAIRFEIASWISLAHFAQLGINASNDISIYAIVTPDFTHILRLKKDVHPQSSVLCQRIFRASIKINGEKALMTNFFRLGKSGEKIIGVALLHDDVLSYGRSHFSEEISIFIEPAALIIIDEDQASDLRRCLVKPKDDEYYLIINEERGLLRVKLQETNKMKKIIESIAPNFFDI